MWRGFVHNEGRKQWNGREEDESMIIVSYARYMRVPAGSMAGNSRCNRQITSYLELTAAVSSLAHFSGPTICTWTSLLSSPLYASTSMY